MAQFTASYTFGCPALPFRSVSSASNAPPGTRGRQRPVRPGWWRTPRLALRPASGTGTRTAGACAGAWYHLGGLRTRSTRRPVPASSSVDPLADDSARSCGIGSWREGEGEVELVQIADFCLRLYASYGRELKARDFWLVLIRPVNDTRMCLNKQSYVGKNVISHMLVWHLHYFFSHSCY